MCAAAADAEVPRAGQRAWWAELGAVVPRSLRTAMQASRGGTGAALPPLATNPLTWATLAVDELAVSAAYLLSRRTAEEVSQQAVDDAAAAVRALRQAGAIDDPRLVHPVPSAPAEVRVTRRRRAGIDFEHLSFVSQYVAPVELPGADRWAAGEANRRTHAYLLRHGDRPRPWAVVLHGHRMGEPRDLRLLGSRRLQHDLGVDVAHLVLPMHGPRGRGGGSPFPGVDPIANLLGMAQAVWDARTLLAWLRLGDRTPVGVYGVSLGGHVAGLLAGLDAELAAVVAGVPTSDLSTMLADTMRARWGEETVRASHVLDDDARALSRLVSPLAFPPLVDRDRLFVYAAIGDRLVTPQQAVALWEHWDRPQILWLQGGHIVNNLGASRRFVVDAFAACGLGAGVG
jgi:hypothetical protein